MVVVVFTLVVVLVVTFLLELKEPRDERRDLNNMFPLYKMENGFLLSKQGDVTLCLELELPEVFTLSTEEYDRLHALWTKAMELLPVGSVLHKKDVFTKDEIGMVSQQKDFLSLSANSHFKGRTTLKHRSFLMLTMKAPGRKPASHVSSNLLRKHFVESTLLDNRFLMDFQTNVARFEKVLSGEGLVKSRRLSESELLGTKEKTDCWTVI